jgi:chemotaxis methyl-accepting protein methylase
MEREREFTFLLDKIRRNRSIDFSQYRSQVLKRRILHRLHLTGCVTYWDYILLLNRDPQEYDRLIEYLTIKVSEFFRDVGAFDVLAEVVIPEIIDQKKARGSNKIRVWSCGAAFGQEAYSVAILLCEALGSKLNDYDARIVATDIDKSALESAPWGSFEKGALRKMSPHILFKYFTRIEDRYVVSDRLRALVSFEYHDIVSGRSKSFMDLVLCRNLLIYFEKELQQKALCNLHRSLNPGGFLILGKTESIAPQMSNSFEVVDLRERVYRKKWI